MSAPIIVGGVATGARYRGFMPLLVILAVGLDSSSLTTEGSVWKSAGYAIIRADSIREAIVHIGTRDFDLVLLDPSISTENKERLTFLIRASGSLVPVVCVSNSCGECNSFADATLGNDSSELLSGIGKLLARIPAVQTTVHGTST
jgi:DNA-binding response OmpR family regulator